MSLVTRTYTFTDGTTAFGSQVDSEIANIVNTLNNLDTSALSWTTLKVSTTSVFQGGVTLSSTSTFSGAATFTVASNFANGSAATPSINLGDATTGLYRGGANALGISLAGAAAAIFRTTGTSAATTYRPLELYGGAAAGNGEIDIEKQTTTGITNSATTFITINDDVAFVFVCSSDSGGGNISMDLLLCSSNGVAPTVVSARNAVGAPAARTYSASGFAQKVLFAAGTYGVSALSIGISRPNG